MKWETDWWGITVTAESQADNDLIDKLSGSLPEKTEERYEDGEIKLETNNGFKKIIFNR